MCCGGARSGLGQPAVRAERLGHEEVPAVRFTYTGRTALNVIGSTTRRLYRFQGTGATLAVDRGDAYGLAAVPMLRRLE